LPEPLAINGITVNIRFIYLIISGDIGEGSGCDQGTSARDPGQDWGTRVRAEAEAVASETEDKTEAVDPETEANAARQLIGIGYSIPVNIKYR